MAVVNLENLRRSSSVEHEVAHAVGLDAPARYVLARDPSLRTYMLEDGTRSNTVLGQRPFVEAEIIDALKAVSGILSLVVVDAPTRGGSRLQMVDGWNGKAQIVISEKRTHLIFISRSLVNGKSIINFEMQEVSGVGLRKNLQCFGPEKGLVRLNLWGDKTEERIVKNKKLLARDVWGGSVEVDGDVSRGLLSLAVGVIDRNLGEAKCPLWREVA